MNKLKLATFVLLALTLLTPSVFAGKSHTGDCSKLYVKIVNHSRHKPIWLSTTNANKGSSFDKQWKMLKLGPKDQIYNFLEGDGTHRGEIHVWGAKPSENSAGDASIGFYVKDSTKDKDGNIQSCSIHSYTEFNVSKMQTRLGISNSLSEKNGYPRAKFDISVKSD